MQISYSCLFNAGDFFLKQKMQALFFLSTAKYNKILKLNQSYNNSFLEKYRQFVDNMTLEKYEWQQLHSYLKKTLIDYL